MKRTTRLRLIRLALLLATASSTPAASQYIGPFHYKAPSRTLGECIASTRDPAFCARIYRDKARYSCMRAHAAKAGRWIGSSRACGASGPSAGPIQSDGLDEAIDSLNQMETNALLGEIVEFLDGVR